MSTSTFEPIMWDKTLHNWYGFKYFNGLSLDKHGEPIDFDLCETDDDGEWLTPALEYVEFQDMVDALQDCLILYSRSADGELIPWDVWDSIVEHLRDLKKRFPHYEYLNFRTNVEQAAYNLLKRASLV